MEMLKKTYKAVAVLAILHMLALGGGIAYLIGTGKLDAERARAVADVFRSAPQQLDEEGQLAQSDAGGTQTGEKAVPPDPVGEEVHRRSLEREYMQADHRLILANRQMMEVRRRQEEFERREAQQAAERERIEEEETKEGFQRDLEVLSMLKPKVAVDTLLARPIDEAARLMLELDARKAKKIVETANKDPRQWSQMLQIQERMRDLSGEEEAAGV